MGYTLEDTEQMDGRIMKKENIEPTDQVLVPANNRITSERLVMKDHELIMAGYSLTVEEQRLILACIEKAQRVNPPLNSDAIKITINVKEYAAVCKINMGTAYKALETGAHKLYEQSVKINDEGVRREVRWLQEKAIYDSGKVTVTFSAMISKHIRDIVTKRAIYRLEQATQLRSQHAIRLFEILQIVIDPESQQGEWEVTLTEFKELLELPSAYDRWIDLRKRVIESSLAQINKNTSLRVEWEIAAKEGRQISAVRFTVFESNQLSLGLT